MTSHLPEGVVSFSSDVFLHPLQKKNDRDNYKKQIVATEYFFLVSKKLLWGIAVMRTTYQT